MPETGSLSEAFLEQSPACLWIVDPDFTFHRVFGASAALFGKSPAELVGRPAVKTLPEDVAKTWEARFSRALAGETLYLRERVGASGWYITVFPIRTDGGSYAGAIAREISPWQTAEQELRNTVLGALKSQEFERNMLSKFLHDVVGQNLTALGLQLDLARMDLETVSPDTCERLSEVQKVLENIMEQVRDYSYHLNPSAVERAGLRSALDRLIIHIKERFAGGLRINVDPNLKLDPKVASAFFHIAQEALENAVQHASCSSIEIALRSTRTGISIEIRDNGKGFDPSDTLGGGRGLGLLSMEHYAAQAGLDLSVTSNRKTGTVVRATVPETL